MASLLSKIYSLLKKDDAVQLDASWQPDASDRRFIDNQILGIEQHLLDSLIQSKHASWYQVTGATVQPGDVVCSAAAGFSSDGFAVVTLATAGNLGPAKSIVGVVVQGGASGTKILVANAGILPPTVTGLPAGSSNQAVRVSTAGRCEAVASIGPSDFPVGVLTTDGNLTVTSPISPGLLTLSGGGGSGVTYTLDNTSPALVAGDWVCLLSGSSSSLTITKALPTPLANAGVALGMVIASWSPGAVGVIVAIGGTATAAISGLSSGVAGDVFIDSTARSSRTQTNYRGGYCDTAGKVTILPRAHPLGEINVLKSPWNFDNTGATDNVAKLNTLLTYLGTTPRLRLYFPAGDYLWNSTCGPFPAGIRIRGDGVAGGLTGDDPGFAGASANRANYQVSGTRFLCAGTGVGVQLGHDSAAPGVNVGGDGVFEDITVLGRHPSSAQLNCIIGASNTSPITITTNKPHGYSTGDQIIVRGVQGNTAANSAGWQPWTITVTGANTFTLDSAIPPPNASGVRTPFTSSGNGAFSMRTFSISNVQNGTDFPGAPLSVFTTTAHSLPFGARVMVSGVTSTTGGSGNLGTFVNNGDSGTPGTDGGEWQSVPFPVDPNQFRLNRAGDPFNVATHLTGYGTYSSGGTVSYGGHCLRVNGINDIGIEVLGAVKHVIRNCRIGGFKYGISFDGAEVCRAENIGFDASPLDLFGQVAYKDIDTEIGVDSAFAVRIGDQKFSLSGSTNHITIDGYNLNYGRAGFLHVGGVGHYISNGNTELSGALAVLAGAQNVVYENVLGEGTEVGSFLVIAPGAGGGVTQMTIRDITPYGLGPFIWGYHAEGIGTIGTLTLHGIDFTAYPHTFAPIHGATYFTHVRDYGCSRPINGSYIGALTDAETQEQSVIIGESIGSNTAAQGALDVRLRKQGLPSAQFRASTDVYKTLGSSNGYPNGSATVDARDWNVLLRNRSHNTGLIASQQAEHCGWVYLLGSGAAAHYVKCPIESEHQFDGIVRITMNVVALREDALSGTTPCAEWRIRQFAKWSSHSTLTLLGTPTTEVANDLDTGFTAPTIAVDTGGPVNQVCANLTPYTGHTTEWCVIFTLDYVGH